MTLFPGVALVTGSAGTGIGAGVARAFAAAGCRRIAITDIAADQLQLTKAALEAVNAGIEVYAEAGDIADADFVDGFVERAAAALGGRIDYAVNCAGIKGDDRRSTDTTPADFDRINGVNYRGCWLSSRAVLRQMLRQSPLPSHDAARPPQRGAIVNIASQLALVGRPEARAFSFPRPI